MGRGTHSFIVGLAGDICDYGESTDDHVMVHLSEADASRIQVLSMVLSEAHASRIPGIINGPSFGGGCIQDSRYCHEVKEPWLIAGLSGDVSVHRKSTEAQPDGPILSEAPASSISWGQHENSGFAPLVSYRGFYSGGRVLEYLGVRNIIIILRRQYVPSRTSPCCVGLAGDSSVLSRKCGGPI